MTTYSELCSEKILNSFKNEQQYVSDIPKMTGHVDNDMKALHEIHIFLLPLNPSQSDVDSCVKLVEQWNSTYSPSDPEDNPDFKPMKMCLLALNFRKPNPSTNKIEETIVRVLQSSRYFYSDDFNEVVQECHNDATYFANSGFVVVREKIEGAVPGIGYGIPEDTDDMEKYPTKYFESHIRVSLKMSGDKHVVSEQEENQLRTISKDFESKFKCPIPLSHNSLRGDDGGCQRYLNVRYRLPDGRIAADEKNKAVIKMIQQSDTWNFEKIIFEYVWYDTYPEIDQGWIDFTEEEKKALLSN